MECIETVLCVVLVGIFRILVHAFFAFLSWLPLVSCFPFCTYSHDSHLINITVNLFLVIMSITGVYAIVQIIVSSSEPTPIYAG